MPTLPRNSKLVPYWVLVKKRTASTNWKWASQWIRQWRERAGPPPKPLNREIKQMNKARLDALHLQTELDIYVEEVLNMKPNQYLHGICPDASNARPKNLQK